MQGEITDISTTEISAKIDALLDSFAHFGVELGLERIERLLANLGNPQRRVPIIHVAGSNGKGSVCAYLSSVLAAAGYRVGRYTSPHLVDWTERISLNGQAIAPTVLHTLLLETVAAIRPDQPSPTQFEVITAAAWLYFAQQQVDIAVVEVGLGGRLDATNVCDRPLVSIITSLSREHWQRLGPTLADISREKAGILKSGCPAVLAPLPPEAEPVVRQRLAELGCPAIFPLPAGDVGDGWAMFSGQTADGGSPVTLHPPLHPSLHPPLHPLKYRLPLPGAHQYLNSALAIAALQVLQHSGWQIDDDAIAQGIAATQWPGRLQWSEWSDRPLLIDGAHNPAAAQVLRDYVDHSDRVVRPIHWVMGMLTTKDHADIFAALLRPGDRLSLVPVPDHLSADPQELATLAQQVCPELALCQVFPEVFAALAQAAQLESDQTTILCGSLYLIGHFFRNRGLVAMGDRPAAEGRVASSP
ncbi:MAG TPA: folylpolyglutamate synthase/dihydrofolate synthase family protein [Chroococcidiopsis sp.]